MHTSRETEELEPINRVIIIASYRVPSDWQNSRSQLKQLLKSLFRSPPPCGAYMIARLESAVNQRRGNSFHVLGNSHFHETRTQTFLYCWYYFSEIPSTLIPHLLNEYASSAISWSRLTHSTRRNYLNEEWKTKIIYVRLAEILGENNNARDKRIKSHFLF